MKGGEKDNAEARRALRFAEKKMQEKEERELNAEAQRTQRRGRRLRVQG